MTNDEVVAKFVLKQNELIDMVLRGVLTKYLKFPPTLADAKKTKRIFNLGDHSKFTVVYEDVVLGYVEFTYPDPVKGTLEYGVTFKESKN